MTCNRVRKSGVAMISWLSLRAWHGLSQRPKRPAYFWSPTAAARGRGCGCVESFGAQSTSPCNGLEKQWGNALCKPAAALQARPQAKNNGIHARAYCTIL
ncbi:hypothetical protein CC78DRAFT_574393 [Lojkania enalia]|uniref:Uncharacterized protein n=1 Tax=Lojkania enalia TaxID=147567 RepID=A0A9P4TQR0_9PLEO|nr:hypothetical protein CC78DRAFT_574393 [Didymosphaeria enalia]